METPTDSVSALARAARALLYLDLHAEGCSADEDEHRYALEMLGAALAAHDAEQHA